MYWKHLHPIENGTYNFFSRSRGGCYLRTGGGYVGTIPPFIYNTQIWVAHVIPIITYVSSREHTTGRRTLETILMHASSHVRVPLCRPCGVLSLFNRTVARAFIRSIGLCGSGYTAMTAIPNVLFNRPQCALFSGLFFPVLSMVGLVRSYQPSYIPNSYRRGQISCGATACISCAGNSLFFRPMCRP